jgi:activator of HSP90 ATPase
LKFTLVAQQKTQLPPKTETSSKLDKLESQSIQKPTEIKSSISKPEDNSTTSFTITEKFMCSPNDLFDALLDQNRVRAYAGGDSQINRENGSRFSLFGGSVVGQIIEMVNLNHH